MKSDKCVVFDFDCTLTKRHFYHFLNNYSKFKNLYDKEFTDWDKIKELKERVKPYFDSKSSIISNNDIKSIINIIFGGTKRLTMIKSMLNKLHNNKIHLNISSRGCTNEIYNFLRLYDLCNYFNFVNGCRNTYILSDDKDKYIKNTIKTDGKIDFFKRFIINRYNFITYIDDDKKEHNIMKKYWKYNFIDSLERETGGGISEKEIIKIENIYKL
jgi:hypothetical protein